MVLFINRSLLVVFIIFLFFTHVNLHWFFRKSKKVYLYDEVLIIAPIRAPLRVSSLQKIVPTMSKMEPFWSKMPILTILIRKWILIHFWPKMKNLIFDPLKMRPKMVQINNLSHFLPKNLVIRMTFWKPDSPEANPAGSTFLWRGGSENRHSQPAKFLF